MISKGKSQRGRSVFEQELRVSAEHRAHARTEREHSPGQAEKSSPEDGWLPFDLALGSITRGEADFPKAGDIPSPL